MFTLLTSLFVLATTTHSAAQQAVCTASNTRWVFNSLGQSPCTVASYLGSPCSSTGGVVGIPPLGIGKHYLGPNRLNSNACKCSTVFYSLLAACAICQDRNYLGWSEYKENCSTTYPGIFPMELPAGTSVPNYAYQDVVRSDSFNPSLAQQDTGAPESTGNAHPTGTGYPASDSGGSGGSGGGSGGKGKAKVRKILTGPIIGIIVGCFVVITFIATVAGWFIRRRRARSQIVAPNPAGLGQGPDAVPQYLGEMGYKFTPYTPPPTGGYYDPSMNSTVKYYNPADPTTFSSMAAPSPPHTPYTVYHPQPHAQPQTGYTYYPPTHGQYSVVPQAGY